MQAAHHVDSTPAVLCIAMGIERVLQFSTSGPCTRQNDTNLTEGLNNKGSQHIAVVGASSSCVCLHVYFTMKC